MSKNDSCDSRNSWLKKNGIGLRAQEKNNYSILLVLAPVYGVPSAAQIPNMHRRMRLVDERKSGAIWCNYFFTGTLNPVDNLLPIPYPNDLPDDPEPQPDGIVALFKVQQCFGVTAKVLCLQIKVQVFSQKSGHGIGKVQLHAWAFFCPPPMRIKRRPVRGMRYRCPYPHIPGNPSDRDCCLLEVIHIYMRVGVRS